MRSNLKYLPATAAIAFAVAAVALVAPRDLSAQRGGANPNACVSPMPMPIGGGPGMFGAGRGGRGRGQRPDSSASSDSTARPRPPRGRGGCPPYFPDSLALTPAQKQQIVNLRTNFAQTHSAELAQLRSIEENARQARQSGQTDDQVRAIQAQAAPIRTGLREPEQAMQVKIEATLTPGQLAWMKAHMPPGRGARGRPQ